MDLLKHMAVYEQLGIFVLLLLSCWTAGDDYGCVYPEGCSVSSGHKIIDCHKEQLTQLLSCISKHVVVLNMDQNLITSLVQFKNISSLLNLELLYLSNNLIQTLYPLSFTYNNTPRLRELDLSYNNITYIHDQAFYNLISLERLDVSYNGIYHIDSGIFSLLSSSMKYLNLNGNRLTSIPRLGQLPNLSMLYMNCNVIINSTFPSEYSQLHELHKIGLGTNAIRSLENDTFASLAHSGVQHIWLDGNQIDKIAQDAFQPLKTINTISLAFNPITYSELGNALFGLQGKHLYSLDLSSLDMNDEVPTSLFNHLRNSTVEHLTMTFNDMVVIPDGVFVNLNHLQTLDLRDCSNIRTISDNAFSALTSLSILDLSFCELRSIPRNLPSTLKFLNLEGNQLNILPDKSFINLTALQTLYVGSNPISIVYEEAFEGLTNLTKLKMSDMVQNKVAVIEQKTFEPLIKIRTLDMGRVYRYFHYSIHIDFELPKSLVHLGLNGNYIGVIPKVMFNELTNLETLDLSYNSLGYLISHDYQGHLFRGLKSLHSLDLAHNLISHFSNVTFTELNSLKYLSLRGNAISYLGPKLFPKSGTMSLLDVRYNSISVLNSAPVSDFTSGLTLYLSYNPFACTCDMRWFRDWLDTTSVELVDVQDYKCHTPTEWKGKRFLSFDKTKINCKWYSLPVLVICSTGAAFVMLVVIIFCFRNRWFIRLRIYRLRRRLQRAPNMGDNYDLIPGSDKTYDAYISCAEDHSRWAIDNLLPGIDNGSYENKPFGGSFKLYFDGRDSVPGMSHVANIVDNMEQSRIVIIILSKSYLVNARYDFELEHTIESKHKHDIENFVVVKLPGIGPKEIPNSLHKLVEDRNYIAWEDNANAKIVFQETINHILDTRN